MALFGPKDTFEPNEKQARFLASDADICLMGGGAGSGKSLCALILLLRLNEPSGIPGFKQYDYNGMIFRKNRADLAGLWKNAKKIYKAFDAGVKFKEDSGNFKCVFTSGATIFFSYYERFEQCESQIQGQEYQTIVAEEVGQHDEDKIFRYCISRLRSSSGMRCYMRATANPGRFPWLREFFRINDEGESTKFDIWHTTEDGKRLRTKVEYIQAKLADNPYIEDGYTASLMNLSIEDKLALLDGRWDSYFSIAGQVYENELKALHVDNRVCSMKFDPAHPVNTFWDIGIDDLSVILFVQFVGKEIRIIDELKANNVSYRDHYIPLLRQLSTEKGYQYEKHYLPHDGAKRDPYTGKSLFDSINDDLKNCEKITRINKKETAIQLAKTMFPNVWIEKSLGIVDDLIRFRRKWNPTLQMWQDAIHDAASHGADAFGYIAQRPAPSANWVAYKPSRKVSY